jgi:hypothetical protein
MMVHDWRESVALGKINENNEQRKSPETTKPECAGVLTMDQKLQTTGTIENYLST